MKRKSGKEELAVRLAAALLTAAALVIIVLAIVNMAGESREKGRAQLESSVRRSVMACYAAEGIYPPDVDYLREHYALQIDDSRYVVYYDAFAGNLMPDITVLERAQ